MIFSLYNSELYGMEATMYQYYSPKLVSNLSDRISDHDGYKETEAHMMSFDETSVKYEMSSLEN